MVSKTALATVCRDVSFRERVQWHSILERGAEAIMWLTLGYVEVLQLGCCILLGPTITAARPPNLGFAINLERLS
jgi:hypothetical protein